MPIEISTPFNQQEHLQGGTGIQGTGVGPQGPSGAVGPQGYQGYQGYTSSGTPTPPPSDGSVAAGMTNVDVTGHIEAYSPVTVFGEQADTNNPAHFGIIIGIALDEAWPGDNLVVQYFGLLVNTAWKWTPKQKLWVSGTGLNWQPPTTGWNQLVAVVVSETSVFIRLREPILL